MRRKKVREIVYESHECLALKTENNKRVRDRENPIRVVKDNDGWIMYVGIEYLDISHCPCCGEKLS